MKKTLLTRFNFPPFLVKSLFPIELRLKRFILLKLKVSLFLIFASTSLWAQQPLTTVPFIADGPLVVPAGITQMDVEAWGGGGAGGGASDAQGSLLSLGARAGAGGGGGAYAKSKITVVAGPTLANATLKVIVAKSTLGTISSGWSGGNSTIRGFEAVISAAGGAGGAANDTGGSPLGGAGGSSSVLANVGANGLNGQSGVIGLWMISGAGGNAANTVDTGGLPVKSTIFGNGPGNPGIEPGGGGSGAMNSGFLFPSPAQSGGNGARGQVFISYTCPTYNISKVSADDFCVSTGIYSVKVAGLPFGVFTVTYTINNSATESTSSMEVNASDEGTFIVNGLAVGTSLITVKKLTSGTCSNAITANNTTNITVFALPIGGAAVGGTTICNGSTSGLLSLMGNSGTVLNWQSSVNPFTSWTDITNTAALTTYTSNALTATTQFRAVVKNGICNLAYSTPTTVVVKTLLTAPTVVITPPTCTTSTGSVVLSGLPVSGTLIQTDGTIITRFPIPNPPIISGLAPGKYKFALDDCTPVYSQEVVIQVKINTWTGTWSNGTLSTTPGNLDIVDFQSNYDVTGDMSFCAVTVGKGVKITVEKGKTMTVVNGVHVDSDPSTSLTFENNASLMQTNITSGINTGSIKYMREAGKILRGDFVYWSTPVTPQTLFKVSPLTSGDKYLGYNGDDSNWVVTSSSELMMPGKGYIIRGPQTNDNIVPQLFTATFEGTPNNGNITGESVMANKYYLIGNPYPSALKAKEFLDNNPFILGTLYFWTHNTRVSLQGAYEYASTDYATYNLTGSTAAGPLTGPSTSPGGLNRSAPLGYIAAGQSFFARTQPVGHGSFTSPKMGITFNNDMRAGGTNNSLFFKPGKTSKETAVERNRIWLNLTNTEGAFKQTLVGYVEGATNDFDDRYDGISFDGNEYIDFYSINNQEKFTIQGRAVPFENTDLVPLGYRTTITGDFTISIDQGDGVFTEQAIYLEDKKTGTVNDLRAANYTFTTTAGTFTDRFVLRYTNKTLGTGDFENLENTILVSVKDKLIKATSTKETIKEVIIFDVSGKLLYDKNKVNATELQISDFFSSNQVLLVKVTLENGYSTTRKIIFK